MVTESDFFGGGAPERHVSSIPPNLSPGLRIADRYELVRKIGSGAMGEVWAARHVSLQEEVAIKLVLREVAHGDGSSADSRFLLEARVASQLSRKTRHIVSVTDHGEHGPYAYLVMELLNGESLDARLARTGPMPLAKVVPLVYQVARALSVAHADGIVHRDLKPSNVFVTVDEEGRALVKILDFGIAKLRPSMRQVSIAAAEKGGTARAGQSSPPARAATTHATLAGFLLGTPAYMSPEQASGRAIDHRADVWALAVIAYHLLTGEFPFDGPTPDDLLARLCRVRPIPITVHRQDLPSAIVDLFSRAFANHVEERFQSAVAFAGALEYVATVDERTKGAPPRPMGSISIPPASELGRPPSDPRKPQSVRPRSEAPRPVPADQPPSIESSIVAAGVPRRQKLWPRLLAGIAVLAVLLGTASMLHVYFERDVTKAPGVAEGAATIDVGASHAVLERDVIPPPDPAAAIPEARLADLPAAPSMLAAQTIAAASAPRPTPQLSTTTASLPPDPPPISPSPASPAAQQQASKRIDRSEVF